MKDEKYYADRYPRTCDVTLAGCYLGGKWCATCMYSEYGTEDFQFGYCTAIRKEN